MTDEELIARLRMVTGFIRFETGDRVAASICLSEEAADRIEALLGNLRAAFDAGFDNGWDHARYDSNYDDHPLGCEDAFNTFLTNTR